MGGIIKGKKNINESDFLFRPINNESSDGSIILIP